MSKLFWFSAFMAVSTVASAGEKPVDFTFGAVKADKSGATYKLKVNTDKPIRQVDINVKYKNAAGGLVQETIVVWKNIVKSVRQPIKKGETYEGTIHFDEGVTGCEARLERVAYTDDTDWKANK